MQCPQRQEMEAMWVGLVPLAVRWAKMSGMTEITKPKKELDVFATRITHQFSSTRICPAQPFCYAIAFRYLIAKLCVILMDV